MSLITWIVFGALVGWLASIVTGKNHTMGLLANVAVGIIGAIVGGAIAGMIGLEGVSGFNFSSFAIAMAGSILLIAVINLFERGTDVN